MEHQTEYIEQNQEEYHEEQVEYHENQQQHQHQQHNEQQHHSTTTTTTNNHNSQQNQIRKEKETNETHQVRQIPSHEQRMQGHCCYHCDNIFQATITLNTI